MPCSMTALMNLSAIRAIPPNEINWSLLITELVIAVLLLVCMFLFRKRFMKIACACGTVICLFLACKLFFGSDSLITEIMRWITAIAACILTVSIVNRINWNEVRGKSGK